MLTLEATITEHRFRDKVTTSLHRHSQSFGRRKHSESHLCRVLAVSLKGWNGGGFLGKVDTRSTAGGEIDRRIEAWLGKTQRDP